MHFLQAINSDLSVLIVYNKTGGSIKGDIIKKFPHIYKNLSIISICPHFLAKCLISIMPSIFPRAWPFSKGVGKI